MSRFLFSFFFFFLSGLLPSSLAALCVPTSTLLGLGAVSSLPYSFELLARDGAGGELEVVNAATPQQGGFFLPLLLAAEAANASSQAAVTTAAATATPLLTLSNGGVYAMGGTVLATAMPQLLTLEPLQLFLSADSRQQAERLVALSVNCDGEERMALRFQAVLDVAIASAVTNGSFAAGSGISSPIVDGLLNVGTPIDLLIVPHNASRAE